MLVNVTTYEVLVCPPHMSNRFPRRKKIRTASGNTEVRGLDTYQQSDVASNVLVSLQLEVIITDSMIPSEK